MRGFWLSHLLASAGPEEVRAIVSEVLSAMVDGTLAIPPGGKHFPLSEVQAAVAEATKDARGGKAFLEG